MASQPDICKAIKCKGFFLQARWAVLLHINAIRPLCCMRSKQCIYSIRILEMILSRHCNLHFNFLTRKSFYLSWSIEALQPFLASSVVSVLCCACNKPSSSDRTHRPDHLLSGMETKVKGWPVVPGCFSRELGNTQRLFPSCDSLVRLKHWVSFCFLLAFSPGFPGISKSLLY